MANKVNKATAAWSEEYHKEDDLEVKIAKKLHPQLKLHSGWRLELKNLSARDDENDQIFCELSKFWLPANRIYSSPQRLTSQPHLAAAAVLAVNDYWTVADSEKGQHTRALDLLAAIAKFFEYCWMNGKYRVGQLSEVDFTSLANDLAQGGWQFALNIRSRLESYCLTTNAEEIKSLFTKESINTVRFSEVIATNVRGREPKIYLEALVEICRTSNAVER